MKKETNYIKIIITIFLLICLLFLVLLVFTPLKRKNISLKAANDQNFTNKNLVTYQDLSRTKPTINAESPIKGNSNAKVTIFEYSSFGCPYSQKIQKTLKEITESYKDQIRLVWKDLPTSETYPEAELAHIAARCAQKQNKFWQFHDLIWQNQNNLNRENLVGLANKLKLDTKKFNECLDDSSVKINISNDIKEADKLQIEGMPTLIINNQEFLGNYNLEELKQIIDSFLRNE